MNFGIVVQHARTMGYVDGFLESLYIFPKRGIANSQSDSVLHIFYSLPMSEFFSSYQKGVTPLARSKYLLEWIGVYLLGLVGV